MAVRFIREDGDEILRKVSKKVDVIDERIKTLLDDMAETMYAANGVGLAAPQVGVLKRVVVIDVGDGLMELINPEIVEQEGEQIDIEGCLSIPGVAGEVKRPARVVVEALNREGEKITVEGKELLAVALCHEIDHLDGILFTDKVIRFIDEDEMERRRENKRRNKIRQNKG
ncbi:MAG TPA: peptide deformylase [Hungateiclostridium thermocellum]|jgi:peptide deformylase|uniref:Peptide deformylase n=2 Tax=Acetivibrio thermocellus TaxID=1515 RepID=DEF_ACET2|nr:peptide deformylase [Acetivibrio thermocellus]A3DCX4.1 RecName: Full=Peptide deformylase; Short=PDF; AltName: Full=Polypeptide deformylase [Acetivibrio thermocellus ATCC 27405]CDG35260.1 Peptide deformylase [Acetivibrio thermocellus BC1]ABN51803.1 peptide deformylase [Acetivibrio thermocellus ATCC 27405]ADU74727.1 peptide deformylase [Acetivibrio thermocellus DSM 1313]ALX08678.1 Peptide deformylase [Acetivibrio thermocellus AD2]ANV76430.1 Peptide deformylase [Acetivibrio thermocellus DSM 2